MYLNSNVSPIHHQLKIKYSFDYQHTLITVQSKHLIYLIRNYELLNSQEVWIFLPVFSYHEHARNSLETRWTRWRAEDQRMFKQLLHWKRILNERNSLRHKEGTRQSESALTFNSAEVPLLRCQLNPNYSLLYCSSGQRILYNALWSLKCHQTKKCGLISLRTNIRYLTYGIFMGSDV